MNRDVWRRTLGWSALCLTMAGGVAVAHAQYELDNNLQVGGGRVNPQAVQPDYRARNDLVTGNVAGLGYFRGDIGYRAPGELGLNLPSDRQYRFEARSYGPGASGSDPTSLTQLGQPTVVYRGSSAARSGDVLEGAWYPVRGSEHSNAIRVGPGGAGIREDRPGSYERPMTGSDLGGYLTAPMSRTPAQRSPADVLAVRRGPDGQLLFIEASPLLGLRQSVELPPAQPQPDAEADPSITPENPHRMTGLLDLAGWRVDPRVQPTATLALAVDALVRPAVPGRADEALAAALAVRDIMLDSAAPTSADQPRPGEDVYHDLLRSMRQRLESDGPIPPVAPTPPIPEASADPLRSPTLREPDAEELARAEAERVAAMRRARGLDDPPGAAPAPTPSASDRPGPSNPDSPQAPPAAGSPELDKLLAVIRSANTLKSFAGMRDDRLGRSLRQAEQDLIAGRYFDAEAAYRLALDLRPGYPLARVGLVHAQIGAGLVRSAAINLRQLFDAHPELMGVRYDARLFPAGERLGRVRGEIEEIATASGRHEPALLLAYLGHQTGSAKLTRYGLDLADARSPGEPVLGLLRRLWLGGSVDPAGGPSGRPSPAVPPGGVSGGGGQGPGGGGEQGK